MAMDAIISCEIVDTLRRWIYTPPEERGIYKAIPGSETLIEWEVQVMSAFSMIISVNLQLQRENSINLKLKATKAH